MKALASNRLQPMPWLITGVISIGIVGVLSLIYLQRQQPPVATQKTIAVQQYDLMAKIQASGVLQAERIINLSPEDSGKIAELLIQEGDFVVKGQVIARMTSRRNQAEIAQ